MENSIIVKEANNAAAMKSVFEIRKKVFVQEQHVSEHEEYDEFETSSRHLIAILNGEAVGTCRYRNTDKGIKLERFAVLKEFRGMQIGHHLLIACLGQIDTKQIVYLHAQVQVTDFYSKYNFVKKGRQFIEAGIQHYKMVYTDR